MVGCVFLFVLSGSRDHRDLHVRTHAFPTRRSSDLVEGWKPVTEAVHQEGGRIVAQLWHMGRVVHSVFNDGKPPVSASATQAPGKAHTPVGRRDYEEIGRAHV